MTLLSSRRSDFWTINLGSIGGVPLRLHTTFLLLLIWVYAAGGDSAVTELLFVVGLFVCVLLHELGHVIAARFFGVGTREITLYPFGGVAVLLKDPDPLPEFFIALAGPLVNFLLAFALVFWINWDPFFPFFRGDPIAGRLFIANIVLGIFNMIPALPMDGGRVLRAFLALCNVSNATTIAARISQVLCVAIGILAVLGEQPILLLIAFLIFFSAVQEKVRFETKKNVVGITARNAMIPKDRMELLTHGMTIDAAGSLAVLSPQTYFPVVVGENVLGLVSRDQILQAASSGEEGYIGSIMDREVPEIADTAPLGEALEMFEKSKSPVLIVRAEGEFLGLILYERMYDYLVFTNLRRERVKGDDSEWIIPG
jgi:Zn-dependent protease